MKNLRYLDLSYNKFEGNLPPCLSNLTSLETLDFLSNRLSGKIPSSLISNLKSLDYLSLSQNQFDGLSFTSPFSNQLKFLSLSKCNLNMSHADLLIFLHNQYSLEYIRLSHNNLYGRFPNWLVENNTRLFELLLRNNSLIGHVQFGFLPLSLEKFDISNNGIQELQTNTGVVLSKLDYLNVSRNKIEGTLPTSIGYMNNLFVLDFSRNKFSGEIPESWALNISNPFVLILSYNMLQGRISPSLFNSSNLNILCLSNNQFTGNLPSHIVGNLSGLEVFDVSQNHMSGRIPSWIGELLPLTILILQQNSFHGPIPLELCNSSYLEFLELSHNHLSGSIPSCLNLTSLKYMHLQGNKFSGSIPKAIFQSRNLITLNLKHNNISGNIPEWFGLMSNLRVLLLKGNSLSGPVSNQLCQLKNVSVLDLSYNNFSGPIPPCFSNISFGKIGFGVWLFEDIPVAYHLLPDDTEKEFYQTSPYSENEEVDFMTKSRSNSYKGDILNFMAGIDLSCNQLAGPIPNELGTLTMIKALNLSNNQLTGLIPRTLSNLKQVESMDLSCNKLTGEIPLELTDLNFLGAFNVSYNNLSGEVPFKGHLSTFDESSYKGNSNLCGPPLQKPCKIVPNSTTLTYAGLTTSFGMDLISLFASFGASYIMTLAGLVIVLYINPYWRHTWFNFIDACLSFMFPFWSDAIYKVGNP